jgi:hypothetical protein
MTQMPGSIGFFDWSGAPPKQTSVWRPLEGEIFAESRIHAPIHPASSGTRHDGSFHRLHRHRIRNRAADAFLRERIQGLHLEPGIFVARAVEHIGAEWQIVAVAVKLGISLQGNILQL